MKKRIFSLFLCVILMFTLVSTTVNTKAEANPTIGLAAYEVVAWVLGLCGVTFITTGAMYQAAGQAYYEKPALKAFVDAATITYEVASTANQPTMVMTKATLLLLPNAIKEVKEFFSMSKEVVLVPSTAYETYYDNLKYTTKSSFATAEECYANCPYGINDTVNITVNSVAFNYKVNIATIKDYKMYSLYLNNTSCSYHRPNSAQWCDVHLRAQTEYDYKENYMEQFKSLVDFRWGFRKTLVDGVAYLTPYIAYSWVTYLGVLKYGYKAPVTPNYYGQVICLLDGVGTVMENVKYQNAISFDVDELVSAINKKAIAMTDTDSISIPMDEPVSDVVGGQEEVTNPVEGKTYAPSVDWASIWEALGIKEWMKTVEQNTSVTENDLMIPQLPSDITKKFPFCVPFDMIRLVGALNATAKVPIIDVPIRVKALNYSDNFRIDLTPMEPVAVVFRWGNTILFLLGLTLLTRRLIKG